MTARWSDPHRLPGPPACCDPGYARAVTRRPMSGDEPGVTGLRSASSCSRCGRTSGASRPASTRSRSDQALGVERRAGMQRSADSIYARLDGHDRDLDRMLRLAEPR